MVGSQCHQAPEVAGHTRGGRGPPPACRILAGRPRQSHAFTLNFLPSDFFPNTCTSGVSQDPGVSPPLQAC